MSRMNERELFARSQNGINITYDPLHSHASTHFADTPHIMPYVRNVLENTIVAGDMMRFDADTGVDLGLSGLVETDESDEIVYAVREKRDRPIRFTKSREAVLSRMVSVILTRLDDGTYDLFSAWLGPQSPPAPNSPHANEESVPFWSNHALVWGTQEIVPGSETTECPW